MARSISKGPFVDGHLQKKVDDLNKRNEKKVASYTHKILMWLYQGVEDGKPVMAGLTPPSRSDL